MGEPHTAHVDTAAVRVIANHFEHTADLIGRAGHSRLQFDGASAGRAHPAHGDELRRALEELLADVNLWARAAAEIAAALRAAAERYRSADVSAAAGIG
ncbi:MAG: type VII secretion target [Mycobacterium sp.]